MLFLLEDMKTMQEQCNNGLFQRKGAHILAMSFFICCYALSGNLPARAWEESDKQAFTEITK
jgi:hypothetical protein